MKAIVKYSYEDKNEVDGFIETNDLMNFSINGLKRNGNRIKFIKIELIEITPFNLKDMLIFHKNNVNHMHLQSSSEDIEFTLRN